MALIAGDRTQTHTHSVVVDDEKQNLHSRHDAEDSAILWCQEANEKAKALGVKARFKVVAV
jgi:hypothetical protein